MKRFVALSVMALAATVGACKPPPANSPPPPPPTASAARGYLIRITVLDRNAELPASRVVDCSIAAYSGRTTVLIKDPKTGQEKPYLLTLTLLLPQENTIHVYDPPRVADRIDYTCVVTGFKGDSIDCQASMANSGKVAALFSSRDFDIIKTTTGTASCWGKINARETM